MLTMKMKISESNKRERILKKMENSIKSPYITVNDDVRSILSYLYDHQNRNGEIFFSMKDLVWECKLFHLGEDRDTITEKVKDILFELEWDVLDSTEDLIGITEEHYDELIILEFIDEFKLN